MSHNSPVNGQSIYILPFSSGIIVTLAHTALNKYGLKLSSCHQLGYLQEYLNKIGTKSIVVEEHYFDSDYAADYAAFYASSFRKYQNSCWRLHFFKLKKDALDQEVYDTIELAQKSIQQSGNSSYQIHDLSSKTLIENYNGFCVLRPLENAPLGRTIVVPYGDEISPKKDEKREFIACRRYSVHLFGLRLTVSGTPFQQQDLAVSACATVALWIAFSHLRGVEELAKTTPASITSAATQFQLIGPAMPSPGLSIDQMNMAIHAIGLVPHQFKILKVSALRQFLHLASTSELAVILILQSKDHKSNDDAHAVVVSGLKTTNSSLKPVDGIIANPDRIIGLYINDDRHGPYLRAHLNESNVELSIGLDFEPEAPQEIWAIKFILLPMPEAIRTPLDWLVVEAERLSVDFIKYGCPSGTLLPIEYSVKIVRNFQYIERLIQSKNVLPNHIIDIDRHVSLPRYVACIEIRSSNQEVKIDHLFDLTVSFGPASRLALLIWCSAIYENEMKKYLSPIRGEHFSQIFVC